MDSMLFHLTKFSKLIRALKLNSTYTDEANVLQLFNILFGTHAQITTEKRHLCDQMKNVLECINEEELNYIELSESLILQEKNKETQRTLIYSLAKFYEYLLKPEYPVSNYLNALFKLDDDEFGILEIIQRGILEEKTLGLNYFSLHSKETKLRKINPYFLKEHAGQLYIVGHCHKHNETRTFLVRRVKGVTTTYDTFEKPMYATEDDLFRYSVGIYLSQEDAQWVEIKCKNHLLPILKEHPIHPSQSISLDSTEYFTVKCQLNITDELKRCLLVYGADIEILYPKSLIKLVVEEYEKINRLYSSI